MLVAGGKRLAPLLSLGDPQDLLAGLFGAEKLPKSSSALKEEDLTVDAPGCGRDGNQEGAKQGHNPKKRGRPSQHPLLACVNRSRDVMNLWKRSGNARSDNHSIEWLKHTLKPLGDRVSIRTGFADSGVSQSAFIKAWEEAQLPEVLAGSLDQVIPTVFFSTTGLWQDVARGSEMAELFFPQENKEGEQERRSCVIRENLREDTGVLGPVSTPRGGREEDHRDDRGCWRERIVLASVRRDRGGEAAGVSHLQPLHSFSSRDSSDRGVGGAGQHDPGQVLDDSGVSRSPRPSARFAAWRGFAATTFNTHGPLFPHPVCVFFL